MTIYEVAKKYNLDYADFLNFIIKNNLEYENNGTPFERAIRDENVLKYVDSYLGKPAIEGYSDSVKQEKPNSTPAFTEQKKQQESTNRKPKENIANSSINYNYFDKVLQVQSIRRMGIVAYILALINPVISLILGIMGKNRGERLLKYPQDLYASLTEAIEYNRKAITLSIIFIVIDIIAAIIGLIIFVNNY